MVMEEFRYFGGSYDCVLFKWCAVRISFRLPPHSLVVVVGGMNVAGFGCQRWSLYSDDVIGGDEMVVRC
jgi:hypothetical protein